MWLGTLGRISARTQPQLPHPPKGQLPCRDVGPFLKPRPDSSLSGGNFSCECGGALPLPAGRQEAPAQASRQKNWLGNQSRDLSSVSQGAHCGLWHWGPAEACPASTAQPRPSGCRERRTWCRHQDSCLSAGAVLLGVCDLGEAPTGQVLGSRVGTSVAPDRAYLMMDFLEALCAGSDVHFETSLHPAWPSCWVRRNQYQVHCFLL